MNGTRMNVDDLLNHEKTPHEGNEFANHEEGRLEQQQKNGIHETNGSADRRHRLSFMALPSWEPTRKDEEEPTEEVKPGGRTRFQQSSRENLVNIYEISATSPMRTESKVRDVLIDEEEFKCNKCERGFPKRLNLRYHLLKAHNDTSLSACEKCKIAFSRKFDLQKHNSVVHDKLRGFPCDQCSSSFSLRKDLGKHVAAIHEGKRPFGCSICQNVFGKKEHLVRHVKLTHNQERPFRCTVCNVAFGTKQNLQEHMRSKSHSITLEKRFKDAQISDATRKDT